MARTTPTPTLARLDDQITWYDGSSITAQRRYKLLEAVHLIAAAALPVTVPFDVHAAVPAAIGALIIVVEGVQQLNQYQQNWISYRSTCEALRHEKYLYLAGAGPYADTPNPTAVLVDRIEGLISQEHAKWISAREKEATATPTAPSNKPLPRLRHPVDNDRLRAARRRHPRSLSEINIGPSSAGHGTATRFLIKRR